MLSELQVQVLSELGHYGHLVWEGGSKWRCIGQDGHSDKIYDRRSLDTLVYNDWLEPVQWRTDQTGAARPIVYRLSQHYHQR